MDNKVILEIFFQCEVLLEVIAPKSLLCRMLFLIEIDLVLFQIDVIHLSNIWSKWFEFSGCCERDFLYVKKCRKIFKNEVYIVTKRTAVNKHAIWFPHEFWKEFLNSNAIIPAVLCLFNQIRLLH